MENKPDNLKFKLSLIFFSISLALLIVISSLIVYFFAKARFESGFYLLYLVWLVIALSIPLGLIVLGIIFFIKSGKKKELLIPLVSSALVPVLIIGVGVAVTTINFSHYANFNKDKWESANADYRGLLIYSFEKQYDVIGWNESQVKDYLGEPDETTTISSEGSPYNGLVMESYNLGFYKDYLDPSFYEVIYNVSSNVVFTDIVTS